MVYIAKLKPQHMIQHHAEMVIYRQCNRIVLGLLPFNADLLEIFTAIYRDMILNSAIPFVGTPIHQWITTLMLALTVGHSPE